MVRASQARAGLPFALFDTFRPVTEWPDSREAKIDEEGQYFSIGRASNPGLPLETPASLGLQPHPKYIKQNWAGNQVDTMRQPLYAMVHAQIHKLDRDKLRAEVSIRTKSKAFDDALATLSPRTCCHWPAACS